MGRRVKPGDDGGARRGIDHRQALAVDSRLTAQ